MVFRIIINYTEMVKKATPWITMGFGLAGLLQSDIWSAFTMFIGIPVFIPRVLTATPDLLFFVIVTVSCKSCNAIAKQSNPEPRFALEAGPIAVTLFIFFTQIINV
mgnify:CR=1 FL=1